ncbi:MAG TPA: M20 family metallopeptidase [Steroidobacteraceae bacterium]|nr:M20 family metallopeptidase [Steroidobacteraceae bacterium]
MAQRLDKSALRERLESEWMQSILPQLCDYVRIPNKSPLFDPDWEQHGHMEAAIQLMARWCRAQPISGMSVKIMRIKGRTPLLFIEIPGQVDDCVLLYGHLDKQPEFTGWHEGLGPWEPVIRDGKLYGRGGADDGYAVFASLAAIAALDAQGIARARCVVLIEACEESGSTDLAAHVEALAPRLGTPSLVVCLDAECSNYEQLWCTTSLRGNLIGTLEVQVLEEGVHSGMGSGIAPSCVRIVRQLLSRIEDEVTGDLLVEPLHASIPPERRRQIAAAASVLGEQVRGRLPFAAGVRPLSTDPVELLVNTTWKPSLTVIGMDGLPALQNAGNVLVPRLSVKLSFRLPPTSDPAPIGQLLKKTLEEDPPYNARVRFVAGPAMGGWDAPALAPWLEQSLARASRDYFGQDAMYLGAGGSIPFMGMLGERFPRTQFLVTGVLGPLSNAHGPNEFLHIATGIKVTQCVSQVLADHAVRQITKAS